jgi:hypothetical protein
MASILRYNNSIAYARNVLGWAAAYATGVVPVDLPPITGPVPPLGDAHLDNYEGLGPGLPENALGLPANDPLALIPMMGRGDLASQLALGPLPGPLPGPAPLMVPQQPQPEQPAPQPWLPPWMQQPAPQEQPSRPAGCAVFCITPTAPAPSVAPAPGDAQMLMPQAPAVAPEQPAAEAVLAPAEQPAVLPPGLGPAPGPAG